MSVTSPCPIDASGIQEQIPALRRYAEKLTRDGDDAADVVQMCLEKAVRNFHSFRPGTSLRSWLFTILYHEFVSEVRRRGRRSHVVSMDDWLEPGVSGGQEGAVEMSELQRAFHRLGPGEREILHRVGIDGESYASVGVHMNLTAGTVKSRVSRARAHLRKILDTPAGGRRGGALSHVARAGSGRASSRPAAPPERRRPINAEGGPGSIVAGDHL